MRRASLVFAVMFVTGAAGAARAQDIVKLSPLEQAIACAPPPTYDDATTHALRIVGSQDTIPRSLFGNRDTLVIGGGTAAGVQLGQQYFIRRSIYFGSSEHSRGSRTLGWIHVIAVNDTTAIAMVDHACGGMVVSDYLEPYTAPVLPPSVDANVNLGEPDFGVLGHIVVGNEDRDIAGVGDFVLIDWGAAHGLMPGTRFAIYRDVGVNSLPLASIGEGVVISTGNAMALTRITRARDAVFAGDYVALRK